MNRNLAYSALFAALIAVSSWISLPVNLVPITMQTFAVAVTAAMLGWRRGMLSFLTYLVIGAIGFPVFSGMRGGIGVLAGPTGGYLIGFFAMVFLIGWTADHISKKWYILLAAMIAGDAVLYLFGTVWFLVQMGGERTLGAALTACVYPFILPDLVKLTAASLVSARLHRIARLWSK